MYVPVTPSPPPSPEAQDLGEQLAILAEEYLEAHPQMPGSDVVRAFSIARSLSRAGGEATRISIARVSALLLGILALAAGLVFAISNGGSPVPVPWIIIGVGALGVVVAAIAKGSAAGAKPVIAVLLGLLVFCGLLALLFVSNSSSAPLG